MVTVFSLRQRLQPAYGLFGATVAQAAFPLLFRRRKRHKDH
jgi:hypothetical protein